MEEQSRRREFERVVLPHLDAAHNLARWLVRDPSLAEDVVQDAFVRAWKYFTSFRGGSSRAWLLQIVRNAAYACMKTERRGTQVSFNSGPGASDDEGVDVELPDPSPGPEAMAAQRQGLAALDEALNALPAPLRECIVLREVELLSYKQIARITGRPIGTVMSRLSRARWALREAVSCGDCKGSSTKAPPAADAPDEMAQAPRTFGSSPYPL